MPTKWLHTIQHFSSETIISRQRSSDKLQTTNISTSGTAQIVAKCARLEPQGEFYRKQQLKGLIYSPVHNISLISRYRPTHLCRLQMTPYFYFTRFRDSFCLASVFKCLFTYLLTSGTVQIVAKRARLNPDFTVMLFLSMNRSISKKVRHRDIVTMEY